MKTDHPQPAFAAILGDHYNPDYDHVFGRTEILLSYPEILHPVYGWMAPSSGRTGSYFLRKPRSDDKPPEDSLADEVRDLKVKNQDIQMRRVELEEELDKSREEASAYRALNKRQAKTIANLRDEINDLKLEARRLDQDGAVNPEPEPYQPLSPEDARKLHEGFDPFYPAGVPYVLIDGANPPPGLEKPETYFYDYKDPGRRHGPMPQRDPPCLTWTGDSLTWIGDSLYAIKLSDIPEEMRKGMTAFLPPGECNRELALPSGAKFFYPGEGGWQDRSDDARPASRNDFYSCPADAILNKFAPKTQTPVQACRLHGEMPAAYDEPYIVTHFAEDWAKGIQARRPCGKSWSGVTINNGYTEVYAIPLRLIPPEKRPLYAVCAQVFDYDGDGGLQFCSYERPPTRTEKRERPFNTDEIGGLVGMWFSRSSGHKFLCTGMQGGRLIFTGGDYSPKSLFSAGERYSAFPDTPWDEMRPCAVTEEVQVPMWEVE